MDIISNQLKDFQLATVNYVFGRLTSEKDPTNRFLVADEVGLGKTLVARGIISKFYQDFKHRGFSELNVVYICSNNNIANQNINRLTIEKNIGSRERVINRVNDLAVNQQDQRNSFLRITALSPNTSFKMTEGGTSHERAILFNIVRDHPKFLRHNDQLKDFLQLDVGDERWEQVLEQYRGSIRNEIKSAFNDLLSAESQVLFDILNHLADNANTRAAKRKLVGKLRRMLGSLCVGLLKPDLIILDEFQRFKSMISQDGDSDEAVLTRSLFNHGKAKVLLLSATPYKMFTIKSEEDNGESHFEEFKFVIDFLLDDKDRMAEFELAWKEYSSSLLNIYGRDWNKIKEQKSTVERLLSRVIARTERITVSNDGNTLLKSSNNEYLKVTTSDVKTFVLTDLIVQKLNDVESPIEYCKSSTFPLSFLEGYQIHSKLQKEVRSRNNLVTNTIKNAKDCFLPVGQMDNYEPLSNINTKLNYLLNDSLYNGASDLLWIPPAISYYTGKKPFLGLEGYSKTLVFSSWIMVPKMIASVSSYECERLTINDQRSIGNSEERTARRYFATGSERQPRARLRYLPNFGSLTSFTLLYPCLTLSKLWKIENTVRGLDDVVNVLSKEIQERLEQISYKAYVTDQSRKDDDRWLLIFMILLDRKFEAESLKKVSRQPNPFEPDDSDGDFMMSQYARKIFRDILFSENVNQISAYLMRLAPEKSVNVLIDKFKEFKLGHPPKDSARLLAYLALGSPAICSHRLLSSIDKNRSSLSTAFYGAFKISDSFRKFFNLPESIAVVDKHAVFDSYWKNVTAYCAFGNFQSMLDEYANALIDHNGYWDFTSEEKLKCLVLDISNNIGLRTVSVAAHTFQSFSKEEAPKHFRCHYAVSLNQSQVSEKDYIRSDSVRTAFNSPFRPFILATTSIGQEGLDFHLYCRKILHWNLPANAVDFEQREGRINRYKNLAIRQNIARKYFSSLDSFSHANLWDLLFELAKQTEQGVKSDLVPYWHVEPDNIYIERQAPVIPFSKDVKKLRDLLRTISVYRISLGQPRQEELVNNLIHLYTEEEIKTIQKELLINLSPFKFAES
jgi:hypothetical protein